MGAWVAPIDGKEADQAQQLLSALHTQSHTPEHESAQRLQPLPIHSNGFAAPRHSTFIFLCSGGVSVSVLSSLCFDPGAWCEETAVQLYV